MNGHLLHEAGYAARPSGAWAKTISFDAPSYVTLTIIRSSTGRLLRVERTARQSWWEDYRCGCVSNTVKRKTDLLGYCPTHGADRRKVFREVLPLAARKRKESA